MADNNIIQQLRNANSKWQGYRFVIFSLPTVGAGSFSGFSSTTGLFSQALLPVAGITEIDFPTVDVEVTKIPSLSTKSRYIPRRETYGELVLRAPTIRQTALWDRIALQIRSLEDPDSTYSSVPEDIVISEYDVSTSTSNITGSFATGATALANNLPIAIWSVRGCQATSFTPASANSQGQTAMPLEELRMQVDSIRRASSLA